MCRFSIITFSFLLCEGVLASNFDQRQTGDLNVQIDLKNFKIFALTKGKEEYVDYDYAYDYSEMTIKPQNGTTTTTKKPLMPETVTETDKDNATLTEIELTTRNIENNASLTENIATADPVTAYVSSTTVATTTIRREAPITNTTTTSGSNNATLLNCKKGFFRNSKGNCELKLQNPSNILLKMLQQKAKSSGGNGVRKS